MFIKSNNCCDLKLEISVGWIVALTQSSNYADDLLILFDSHFFKFWWNATHFKEFYRFFIEKLKPANITTVDVDFDLPGLLMRVLVLIWLLKTKLNNLPPLLFSKAASQRSWMPLSIRASLCAFDGNSITGLFLLVGKTVWLKITWLKLILVRGCGTWLVNFMSSGLMTWLSKAARNFS